MLLSAKFVVLVQASACLVWAKSVPELSERLPPPSLYKKYSPKSTACPRPERKSDGRPLPPYDGPYRGSIGYGSGGPYIAEEPVPVAVDPPIFRKGAELTYPRRTVHEELSSKPLEEFANPTATAAVRAKRDVIEETKMDAAEEILRANTSDIIEDIDLEQSREVDLLFLVDVTGSMSPYIAGVKGSIENIVNDLINCTITENCVQDLQLAFVGYRDFTDKDQFTILPFTENVTDFKDFVSATRAKGGGSLPEDVFGGLDEALKLQWGHKNRTRLIFHIADAPGHGCALHELYSDDFPGGDPEERTAEGLFGRIIEMEIQYSFGNITHDTDRMMDVFSEAYGKNITTFDVGVSGRGSAGGSYITYGGDTLSGEAAPAARRIYESVYSAVDKAVGAKYGPKPKKG